MTDLNVKHHTPQLDRRGAHRAVGSTLRRGLSLVERRTVITIRSPPRLYHKYLNKWHPTITEPPVRTGTGTGDPPPSEPPKTNLPPTQKWREILKLDWKNRKKSSQISVSRSTRRRFRLFLSILLLAYDCLCTCYVAFIQADARCKTLMV